MKFIAIINTFYILAMELELCQEISNKLTCAVCKKQYSRKSSLDKHKILCDFKYKSKREIEVETEESADIPNHFQLVQIVQQLTLKMMKMEEKMAEMQKFIDKKKKKLNIIQWLNMNVTPTIGFKEWVNTMIHIYSKHFEILMEDTIYQCLQKIFEDNLSNDGNFIYPIKCYSQKAGIFYVCEKLEDGNPEWRQAENTDIILILKQTQNGIMRELTKWKAENQYKFDQNDKLSIVFNKAVIKLMSISFTPDNNFGRVKNGLYNYLKTDLKSFEYEFEY